MRLLRSILTTFGVVTAASVAAAQTGGLELRVVDGEGLPLPGATVTISHETGNVSTFAQLTNKDGVASFPVLRPGSGYAVLVEFPGFSPIRHDQLRISLGKTETISVQMVLPEYVERERVVADTTGRALDLESTETTTTLTDEFISDLPIPGRFITSALTLAPGVNDANGDGNPNVHGSRSRDFSMMVSGVRNTDPLTGQNMSRVNPNSIEEMEVVTAGAGVEFGRAQGGFARVIQKQGNNEHEGTFDFIYRTSKLDGTGSQDFNNTADPDFEWVQPGFQVSGPLLRDKLWYFLAYEYIKNENPVNVTSNIEVTTTEAWNNSNRLTWQVSPRNKLSFQYRSDPVEVENFGVSSSRPAESAIGFESETETYSVTWTAPYSPKILVESTLAYQDLFTSQFPSEVGVDNSCLKGSAFLESANCTDLQSGRISGSSARSDLDHRQRLSLMGQATVFGGRFWGMSHQFKFGVNIENERYFRELQQDPTVTVLTVNTAGDDPDGNGQTTPESFQLGFFRLAVPPDDDVRTTGTNWGIYAEDQFKPTPNLTMTLGIRVDREELNGEGRTAVHAREEFEAFNAQITPGEQDNGSVFPDAFTGFEDYDTFEQQMQNLICEGVPASQIGICRQSVSENIVNQQVKELNQFRRAQDLRITNTNFSPAFSLAWSPWSNGKTAFKFAAGRHYNNIPLTVPLQELEPVRTDLTYRVDSSGPARLDGGIQPTISVTAVDPNLNTPYQDEMDGRASSGRSVDRDVAQPATHLRESQVPRTSFRTWTSI